MKPLFKQLGFTLTLVTVCLALHGANDLRKNLHYGLNAQAQEVIKEQIDSKVAMPEQLTPPAYPDTKLDKQKFWEKVGN